MTGRGNPFLLSKRNSEILKAVGGRKWNKWMERKERQRRNREVGRKCWEAKAHWTDLFGNLGLKGRKQFPWVFTQYYCLACTSVKLLNQLLGFIFLSYSANIVNRTEPKQEQFCLPNRHDLSLHLAFIPRSTLQFTLLLFITNSEAIIFFQSFQM